MIKIESTLDLSKNAQNGEERVRNLSTDEKKKSGITSSDATNHVGLCLLWTSNALNTGIPIATPS
jgi:hypothetical protein